jgi:L-galactose dehydrogenase
LIEGNVYGDMTQHIVTKMTVKALKSGVNYIDTAPWYGLGVSEERLGVALENVPRNTYFMATKV